VADLIPVAQDLKKIDDKRYDLTAASAQTVKQGAKGAGILNQINGSYEGELNVQEYEIVENAIDNFGLHTHKHFSDKVSKQDGVVITRSRLLMSYTQSLKILSDIYYRAGHLKLTSTASQGDTS
jgi:hypothetical protein